MRVFQSNVYLLTTNVNKYILDNSFLTIYAERLYEVAVKIKFEMDTISEKSQSLI